MRIPYNYDIYVRTFGGVYVDKISDFISLSIIDIRNGIGSWTLKSRTQHRCPFQKGYGIVVYRNGVFYFSGIMGKVESEWSRESRSWTWSVSGNSDMEYLSWRIILPPHGTDEYTLNKQYRTYQSTDGYQLTDIAYDLIRECLTDEYSNRGLQIIGNPDFDDKAGNTSEELNYRFDNLFDIVVDLMNSAKATVYPVWNDSIHKIVYTIYTGTDLSSSVIFKEVKNEIASVKYIIQAPKYNYILAVEDYDSEETVDDVEYTFDNGGYSRRWKGAYIDNSSGWGSRELFAGFKYADLLHFDASVLPQELQSVASNNKILGLAYAEANKYTISDEGYELEIIAREKSPMYQTDYRIGDIIGLELMDGTEYSGTVEKVQTDVSYGIETIRTSVGVQARGSLNAEKTELGRLSRDAIRLRRKIEK